VSALLLVCALAIDRLLGEPPNRLHPVVWIGSAIKAAQVVAPAHGPRAQLAWGACVALLLPALCFVATHTLLAALAPWPWASFAAGALLLKTTFSLDGLRQAARRMQAALAHDLDAARYELRSLCSRDASALSAEQLVGASVESLAENTSDSVTAPLLYFALFGVPGAMAYRAVNTLDAMIGYHGRYEYLGKAAARLDDLLNFVPARLTAALLLLAGALGGADARRGLHILRRDGASTESPNAGRPMAAMAGLLGVRLTKTDCYALGDAESALAPATLDRAWRIVRTASLLGFALAAAVVGARGGL
jgi:adenosylcobinamide-phosphate synthase